MSSMAKDKERKFLLEVIEVYKNLPALWQIKSKFYHDRDKKNKAYDKLLAKYNRMFPQATKEDLKKKINSLRTNYRKELKKCVNSEVSTGSTHVPTLWYFQEMNFLRDQELSLDSTSSFINTIDTTDGDKDNEEPRSETPSSMDEILETKPMQAPSYTTNLCDSKKRKKIKRPINVSYARWSESKDDYQHWGFACAVDLRMMERTQQIYAKKAIAEIIMEGQLGLLHRHSVKINEHTPANPSTDFVPWDSQYPNQSSPVSAYSNDTPLSPSYSIPSPSYKHDPIAIASAYKDQHIVGKNDSGKSEQNGLKPPHKKHKLSDENS